MSTAQQGFPPAQLVNSSDAKIDNLSVLANTETAYPLSSGVNQLFIKAREINTILKYSFTLGDIALGKYWTIPKGCTESLTALNFTSKIVYIEANQNSVIEFFELLT